MGILEGKSVLVTGVTMNTSIAYKVAEIAAAEGATVVVSNFGRALGITHRVVKRLDPRGDPGGEPRQQRRRRPGPWVRSAGHAGNRVSSRRPPAARAWRDCRIG